MLLHSTTTKLFSILDLLLVSRPRELHHLFLDFVRIGHLAENNQVFMAGRVDVKIAEVEDGR